MPSIRQSLTVSIPTLELHLDMVTETLEKAMMIILLSDHLKKQGGAGERGPGQRSCSMKLFSEDTA